MSSAASTVACPRVLRKHAEASKRQHIKDPFRKTMGHRLQHNVGKSPGIYRMDESGKPYRNCDKSCNYQGIFNG